MTMHNHILFILFLQRTMPIMGKSNAFVVLFFVTSEVVLALVLHDWQVLSPVVVLHVGDIFPFSSTKPRLFHWFFAPVYLRAIPRRCQDFHTRFSTYLGLDPNKV